METKDPINTAIDIAKTAKAVLPQTTEETDGAISTLIGWFNNVVLLQYHTLLLIFLLYLLLLEFLNLEIDFF